VAEITKVYFAAGVAGGAPPSYAATLGGSVDASGPPFTASALATMAEGETRTVGAIGEDALGNRTTLITSTITRAVDTGAATGTPGNQTLTLIASAPNVVRNVGSGLNEPKIAKRARKFLNTSNVGAARLQGTIHAAGSAGTELHWVYSLDRFATAPIETGVFMPADIVGSPIPGGFLPLAEGAIGANICTGWATKGGDGTAVVKVSDLFVDMVSSDAPPDSPDPEVPGDIPQGGPLGNLILDLDARDPVDGGYVDNASVTAWSDRSGAGNHAAPYTTSGTQSAPTFKATGFPGGLPCVRVAGSNQGVAHPLPSGSACTYYFILGNLTGDGSLGAADFWNAPIALTGGANGNNFWVSLRGDGKVQSAINDHSPAARTAALGTAAIDGTGPHIIRFVFDQNNARMRVYIDRVLDHETTDSIIVNAWISILRVYLGNLSTTALKLSGDYAMVLCYDRPHIGTVGTPVEDFSTAAWGTP
jgi:hypothetical protein